MISSVHDFNSIFKLLNDFRIYCEKWRDINRIATSDIQKDLMGCAVVINPLETFHLLVTNFVKLLSGKYVDDHVDETQKKWYFPF